jgi:hypothetical protein
VRKCLKVEYLGRIEYDFQKSRVTGPRDHEDSVSAKKPKKTFHACVPLTINFTKEVLQYDLEEEHSKSRL